VHGDDLQHPPSYRFRYAQVWFATGFWERARQNVVSYLQETGRAGEFYVEALELLNATDAQIRAAERERRRAGLSCLVRPNCGFCTNYERVAMRGHRRR